MKLVNPAQAYKKSYIDFVRDFKAQDELLVPFTLNEDYTDFPAMIGRLEAYARGEGMPEGFVAHRSFWMIDDGRVVGASNLRLGLTDRLRLIGGHIGFGVRPTDRGRGCATLLLAETLVHARSEGISRVLLTCDKTNRASATVIRKNGGVLDSEGPSPDDSQAIIQHYWIDL